MCLLHEISCRQAFETFQNDLEAEETATQRAPKELPRKDEAPTQDKAQLQGYVNDLAEAPEGPDEYEVRVAGLQLTIESM